jgi:hypothetical protein
MNKAEALHYMNYGRKVRHEYFDYKEWMTINPENGNILLEDGCQCSVEEFFSHRTDKSWDEGYELVNSDEVIDSDDVSDDFLNPKKPSFLDYAQAIYPYHMLENHMAEMKDYGLSKKQREATIVPVRSTPKIGRNEPCPCGSGKKNKLCCKI